MRTSTPSWLLGALGALALTVGCPAWAGDPSTWTCETCPFEAAGTHGSVDVGVGGVAGGTAKFGDFTGLDRNRAFGVLGGEVRMRGKDGFWGEASASDLGLDTRQLSAEGGREGRFSVRLGYAEIPHHLTDTAATPFLGVGGNALTLPAGFPAASTAAMPLAGTLQPVDIGFKRSRLDLGASLDGPEDWTYRLAARHVVRDGTQRSAGSFFSSTSQLVAPVDQVTDEFEASAAYTGRRWQASLAYRASSFRNHDDALTWQNPFIAPVAGATTGQLALAPDNQFHQWTASAGMQVNPKVRASAELALGRMTQDSAYLAATLNPNLNVPVLPATSLHGSADTLDASVRVSAAATERLQLTASVVRSERNNDTPSLAYPIVSTDLFLGAGTRFNQPYSFTRDRFKLAADYRGPGRWTFAAGAEQDNIRRTLQETDSTREGTLWLRASARVPGDVMLSGKLSHAERNNTGYAVVAAIQPPENPLLRKFNLADRTRDSAGLRADAALGEKASLGLSADWAMDDYANSPIGLTNARRGSLEADLSFTISQDTQLHAYAQSERIRSAQAGSQQFGLPDWTGVTKDSFDILGAGLTHQLLKGRLQLGGDVSMSRARSDVITSTGGTAPPFPGASSSVDTVRFLADYRLRTNTSIIASYGYERLSSSDWHWDGVTPATVPNLLAFGELAPGYHAHVLRVVLRHRF